MLWRLPRLATRTLRGDWRRSACVHGSEESKVALAHAGLIASDADAKLVARNVVELHVYGAGSWASSAALFEDPDSLVAGVCEQPGDINERRPAALDDLGLLLAIETLVHATASCTARRSPASLFSTQLSTSNGGPLSSRRLYIAVSLTKRSAALAFGPIEPATRSSLRELPGAARVPFCGRAACVR